VRVDAPALQVQVRDAKRGAAAQAARPTDVLGRPGSSWQPLTLFGSAERLPATRLSQPHDGMRKLA